MATSCTLDFYVRESQTVYTCDFVLAEMQHPVAVVSVTQRQQTSCSFDFIRIRKSKKNRQYNGQKKKV
jgi:hypothetical protein